MIPSLIYKHMYKNRLIKNRLKQLFKRFPVVVVSGARQVGKSTLLKHEFGKNVEIVVFDPITDIQNARRDPELFLRNNKTPLILDEIQYAPQLVPVIKRLIDEKRTAGQYILTGSQQWEVMKNLAESLAGRAVFIDMEGFSISESTEDIPAKSWLEKWLENPEKFISQTKQRHQSPISVFEQIWRGGLPEAQYIDEAYLADYFMSYIRTYIERDLRVFAEVQNVELFARFIRLAAALTAQEINFSQFGRELGITPQTSGRWLSMLQSTFQWSNIPAYSGNLIKRLSKKAKGYFNDTGIACFAQAISSPQALSGHPLWGSMFETAVVAEIRKLSAVLSSRPNLYHWRLNSGAEVDIILERDGFYYPIEIKAGQQPSRSDASNMDIFRKSYPKLKVKPGLVIAPTNEFIQLSATSYALPWDTK